jgi:hypothetical protein
MKASRWAMLAIAGAGAAASAYVVDSDRPKVTPASSAAPARAEQASASVHGLANVERAPLSARMGADPFGNWIARPQAAPAAVEALPPPPPPAFPYKYAGTVRHANGVTEAFLVRGGELVPIKAGALLDGGWRIEALTDERIEVTFVPASERRSLLLASLAEEPKSAAAPESARMAPAASYEQANAGPGVAEAAAAPSRAAPIPGVIAGGRAVAAAATPAASQAAPSIAAAVPGASASGATSTPLGAPTAPTGTPLGTEPPAQGSMPLGAAPSGPFPKGVTPTGKLGL